MSENIKTVAGIKINTWTISPNFSSFNDDKKTTRFTIKENKKENLYIKINFKF